MKNTLLGAFVAFLFLTSCTQQNTPSPSNNNNGGGSTTGYTVDQSYFFKINFQNKALYNYVFSINNLILFGSSGATGNISTTTISGITSTSFQISAPNGNAFINHATCSAYGYFSKSGNAIGTHKASSQLLSQIVDLATSKTYSIDTVTSNFNVTSVGLHNITGTFTCNLIDGTTLIPASGSFNLYKQ